MNGLFIGAAVAGGILVVLLLVDLAARRRHRHAVHEAQRNRDRARRRDELEHAQRVERLRIVGAVSSDPAVPSALPAVDPADRPRPDRRGIA